MVWVISLSEIKDRMLAGFQGATNERALGEENMQVMHFDVRCEAAG